MELAADAVPRLFLNGDEEVDESNLDSYVSFQTIYTNNLNKPQTLCCVPACEGTEDIKFPFPKDKKLRDIWIERINPNLKNTSPKALCRRMVCARHFLPEQLIFKLPTSTENAIKTDALPNFCLNREDQFESLESDFESINYNYSDDEELENDEYDADGYEDDDLLYKYKLDICHSDEYDDDDISDIETSSLIELSSTQSENRNIPSSASSDGSEIITTYKNKRKITDQPQTNDVPSTIPHIKDDYSEIRCSPAMSHIRRIEKRKMMDVITRKKVLYILPPEKKDYRVIRCNTSSNTTTPRNSVKFEREKTADVNMIETAGSSVALTVDEEYPEIHCSPIPSNRAELKRKRKLTDEHRTINNVSSVVQTKNKEYPEIHCSPIPSNRAELKRKRKLTDENRTINNVSSGVQTKNKEYPKRPSSAVSNMNLRFKSKNELADEDKSKNKVVSIFPNENKKEYPEIHSLSVSPSNGRKSKRKEKLAEGIKTKNSVSTPFSPAEEEYPEIHCSPVVSDNNTKRKKKGKYTEKKQTINSVASTFPPEVEDPDFFSAMAKISSLDLDVALKRKGNFTHGNKSTNSVSSVFTSEEEAEGCKKIHKPAPKNGTFAKKGKFVAKNALTNATVLEQPPKEEESCQIRCSSTIAKNGATLTEKVPFPNENKITETKNDSTEPETIFLVVEDGSSDDQSDDKPIEVNQQPCDRPRKKLLVINIEKKENTPNNNNKTFNDESTYSNENKIIKPNNGALQEEIFQNNSLVSVNEAVDVENFIDTHIQQINKLLANNKRTNQKMIRDKLSNYLGGLLKEYQ